MTTNGRRWMAKAKEEIDCQSRSVDAEQLQVGDPGAGRFLLRLCYDRPLTFTLAIQLVVSSYTWLVRVRKLISVRSFFLVLSVGS